MSFEFEATLWETQSMAAWVFVSLPLEVSEHIKGMPWPPKPGFGSIRVLARIGSTQWRTSIFPEKAGTFVLPVKKGVRTAEDSEVGDQVHVAIELVDHP